MDLFYLNCNPIFMSLFEVKPATLRDAQAIADIHVQAWQSAYAQFKERVTLAERPGGAWPWLDAYGATAPAEFFAVACEAYWVNRMQFAHEFPSLAPLLDAFFQRPA